MTTCTYSMLLFIMLSVSVGSGLALLTSHGKTTTRHSAVDSSGSEQRAGGTIASTNQLNQLKNGGQLELPQSHTTFVSKVPENVEKSQRMTAPATSRNSAAGGIGMNGNPEVDTSDRTIGSPSVLNKSGQTDGVIDIGESSVSGQPRQRRSAADAAEGGALLAWDKRPRYYRENDGGASTRDWRTNMMRVWGKRTAGGINVRRLKGPNRGGYSTG